MRVVAVVRAEAQAIGRRMVNALAGMITKRGMSLLLHGQTSNQNHSHSLRLAPLSGPEIRPPKAGQSMSVMTFANPIRLAKLN